LNNSLKTDIAVVEVEKKLTLEDIKILMDEAINLVYSISVLTGNQNQQNSTITFTDGASLYTSYGYPIVPAATDIYWRRLINITDVFAVSANSGGTLVVYEKSLESMVFST
jgi:hypothetical protein